MYRRERFEVASSTMNRLQSGMNSLSLRDRKRYIPGLGS